YAADLGEPFATAALCLYRDGRDRVARHGDTTGRGRAEDAMVAIVSLGAPRALALRPRGAAPALRPTLGHRDELVIGRTCPRTCSRSVQLALCTAPPSTWLITPSGLMTRPTSTASHSPRSRTSVPASASATAAQYPEVPLYRA